MLTLENKRRIIGLLAALLIASLLIVAWFESTPRH